MNRIGQAIICVATLAVASGCNITSGSHVLVGRVRPAINPENVKIYLRPPAKFEEVAIVNAASRNDFASDQSLTDSTLLRMKSEAAKFGANGILLGDIGNQQIGSIGQSFGSAFASSSASANAYRYGNMAQASGTGTTSVYGSGTSYGRAVTQKASSGMAIYVVRE